MTDEEFNRYCAQVMAYQINEWRNNAVINVTDRQNSIGIDYSPATDLNQMAEVLDKLWQPDIDNYVQFRMSITDNGINQAMREFIESTEGD